MTTFEIVSLTMQAATLCAWVTVLGLLASASRPGCGSI